MSTTLRVELAEVPTDALRVLADHDGWLTPATVTDRLERPANGIHVRNALRLLRELGLVERTFAEDSAPWWTATDAGRDTVARARTSETRTAR